MSPTPPLPPPPPPGRIGTEHEKFGYQLENLKPIEYEKHVKVLLNALVDRFGW
jgi:glutamate--cysteine ligase